MSERPAGGAIKNPVLRFLATRWPAIVIAIIAIAFIVQNRTVVALTVFWMRFDFPLWLILTIVFLVGALVAWLVGRRSRRDRRR